MAERIGMPRQWGKLRRIGLVEKGKKGAHQLVSPNPQLIPFPLDSAQMGKQCTQFQH